MGRKSHAALKKITNKWNSVRNMNESNAVQILYEQIATW